MTRSNRPPMRKVYILPNIFTAFNMFLGLAAIYNIYLAQDRDNIYLAQELGRMDPFTKACWFIILAGFLDGLDGAVARLTHTQSSFGVQFDSLSDLVSFGVAPSLAAFHLMHGMARIPDRLLVGICALYALCGGLRLARYNIQVEKADDGGFTGLPIPGGAGAVISLALLIHHYDLASASIMPVVFPACVLAAALLMVSEIPYPNLTKKICLKREMPFDTLVSIVLLTTVVWVLNHDENVALIFVLGYCYILYSPFVALVRYFSRASASEDNLGRTEP